MTNDTATKSFSRLSSFSSPMASVLLGGALLSACFAVLAPGSAEAAGSTTCGTASGVTLTDNDKTISGITCTNLAPSTSISFSSFGVDYAFSSSFFQTQSASIAYTISINPLFNQVFSTVGLDSGCNRFNTPPNTCTVIKSVKDQFDVALFSLTSTNGSNVTPEVFASDYKILKIVDNITASGTATVSTVNNSFTQRGSRAPVDSVPGPLPLLGGVAAFGFSRRMRARIRQSVYNA